MFFYHQNKFSSIFPCITKAIFLFIQKHSIQTRGKEVVILGNSYLVGNPVQNLFKSLDSTVIVCNENTRKLEEITSWADIIVSATGIPKLIKAKHIKENCIVFDVGIHMDENSKIVCGDVDMEEVF